MEALFSCEDFVRLHVIADSDEAEAQRVKLCVVRAIRRKAARLIRKAGNVHEAFGRLTAGKQALRRAAERETRRQRFAGDVRVETGVYDFEDRHYGDVLLPAGEYRAVRVVLGSGAGRNWWCVVYPDLCAVEEAVGQALSSPEAVSFYSSVGRFLAGIMRGIGL